MQGMLVRAFLGRERSRGLVLGSGRPGSGRDIWPISYHPGVIPDINNNLGSRT